MQFKIVLAAAAAILITGCAAQPNDGYIRNGFTGKPIVNMKAIEERDKRREEERKDKEYRIYHNGEVIRVKVIGDSMFIYD